MKIRSERPAETSDTLVLVRGEDTEQRFLNTNLVSNDLTRAIAAKLKTSETGGCIALELYKHYRKGSPWLRYSRNRNNWGYRYHTPLSTRALVLRAIDGFDAAGLIVHDRKQPGQYNNGRQSSMRATAGLIEIVREVIGREPIPYTPLRESIIMRDSGGNLVNYRDSRDVDRMRDNVREHYHVIAGAGIKGCPVEQLKRPFIGQWGRGGRAYAGHQQLPKLQRERITFGGEIGFELDFSCANLSMAYALSGAKIPKDGYSIDGFYRDHVKAGVNIMLNTPDYIAARWALAADIERIDRHRVGVPQLSDDERISPHRRVEAKHVIQAILKRHSAIKFYRRDYGLELQSCEARIAEKVWHGMAKRGVPCLPVHDSFVVPMSFARLLDDLMKSASHGVVGQSLYTAV